MKIGSGTLGRRNAGEPCPTQLQIALCNGGTHSEDNLAPALVGPHQLKTKADVREKAKIARIRKRHLGIKKRSTFACSRDSKWRKKINGRVELR